MFDPKHCPIEQIKKQLPSLFQVSADCEITLLKYSENLTYLITNSDSQKYILRLNRPHYHEKDELEGELIWIHQLEIDTDIPLARVIISRNKHFIEELHFPNLSCYCSMFAFLEGDSLKNMHDEKLYQVMEKIGSLTAKLHNHVTIWKDSSKLKRFSWDYTDLFGDTARWGNWSELTLLSLEQRQIYEKAVSIIHQRILSYGKNVMNYGLIHSDLNINNFILHDGEINLIDFDDCGYGWFLYDLAYCVMTYSGDELNHCISYWLKGYEQHRLLSEADKSEIDTFVLLKKIHRFSWIAKHMESDTVKHIDPSFYSATEKLAVEYIQTFS